MRRAAKERNRTKRVWREHQRIVHPKGSNCVCDVQPGRFRKQKVAGCSCAMCKPHKHGWENPDTTLGVRGFGNLRKEIAAKRELKELL